MNQPFQGQQNQIITLKNPKKGIVYLLKNKQSIDANLDRYEGEIENNTQIRILCDCLKNYSDQFMRCLDELIQKPQENIIQFTDFFIDPKTKQLFVIFEYVEKESFINNLLMNNLLDEKYKQELCLDIAKGLYHLHLLGYRHRNISPENLCFVNGFYKIANLHNAVHFVMTEQLDGVGDICYWSQELIDKKNSDHTSDIFALACVIFEIFTQQKLFSPQNYNRQSIPQERVQELQKLPLLIQNFITQVIQGKRDLMLFINESTIQELEQKKKQASYIGSQSFRKISTLQPQVTNIDLMEAQKQSNQSPFIPNNMVDKKRFETTFNFQTKPNDTFNQQTFVPQQQNQSFSFQKPLLQNHQTTFQAFQMQPPQTIRPNFATITTGNLGKLQGTITPGLNAPFVPLQNLNATLQNYPQQSQSNFNNTPQIFDTMQTHQKKNSQTFHNQYEPNYSFQQVLEEDVFKCQIDTSKEEKEKENQRQQNITKELKKVVKEEQLQNISQFCMETNKQNPNLTIAEVLDKLIQQRVKDKLCIAIN